MILAENPKLGAIGKLTGIMQKEDFCFQLNILRIRRK